MDYKDMEKSLLEKITDLLKEKGNYESVDVALINQIPFIIEVMEEAKAVFREHGILVPDERGTLKKNPAIDVWKYYFEKLQSLLTSLGLTPRERAKLKIAMIESGNDGFDDDNF